MPCSHYRAGLAPRADRPSEAQTVSDARSQVGARLPTEAQLGRRKQRHANDLIELRLVSVASPSPRPADIR